MEIFSLFGTIAVKYTDAVQQLEEFMHHARNADDALDDMEDSADDADNALDDMADSVENTDSKFGAWEVTLANLASNAIQNMIDKCTELAKSVVETGVSFSGTMAEVQAISGASSEDMEMLEETARQFGATTKFSATEAAEAEKFMAMAGWDNYQIHAALGGVLNLAAASGEELGTTSDIVTDALTALGLEAENASFFADVLASTTSNSNTTVETLAESLKYCAPIIGSMSDTEEEAIKNTKDLAIALGLMGNAGIKGSSAGNPLKNAIVNLIKPTEQQTEAMANLGFITTETINKIDPEKIEKAQSKVADKTGDLEKKQIAYNQAVEKYGASSTQAQSKLIDLEKAERKLSDAQDELTKAQEGTVETIRTGESVFTDEHGKMKSLGEIVEILRENLGGLDADLTDEEGNLRELDDVISDLSQTEEGLTQAEQLKNAAILFGKQNLSGMLAVINASAEDYDKLTEAIYGSDGAAENMAHTMSDTLGGDMTTMQSAFDEFKLKIYDSVEGPLRNGVQFITNVVIPSLTDLMQNFDKIAPVLAGLTAALIAFKAAMAISGLISAATTAFHAYQTANEGATVAQWLFNGALNANPIVLVISLIAGLVTALVVLWNTNDDFRNAVISGFDKIKSKAKEIWDFFEGFGEFIYDMIHAVKLPHFKISGEFSLNPPSIPTIGVDWYAKGGIMTQPTVFGYNPSTNHLQAGGEAGAEAVAPIDTLLGYIRSAVQEENQALAEKFDSVLILLNAFFPALLKAIPKEVVLDSGAVVGELAPELNAELANISNDDKRRYG